MPGPYKQCRLCAMPGCDRFGPQSGDGSKRQTIRMALDEFGSIRLIDLEHMTQEPCAVQMKVARTTAQVILGHARAKLAECPVHEKAAHQRRRFRALRWNVRVLRRASRQLLIRNYYQYVIMSRNSV